MKKIIFISIISSFFCFASSLWSQVAINTTGNLPDNSAMLDISSDTMGILIPRMTESQRNTITAPVTGLMIYQTDNAPGFYYNSGSSASPLWEMVGSRAGYLQDDGTGNIHYNKGMVGIGTSTPTSKLNIMGGIDTLGLKLSLPPINQLPNTSYTHQAPIIWEGGETKFGKWRNYFNGWENGWALTYNSPYNYTNNAFEGRDSGHPYANIVACMRFNVAEGNSGWNTFEIAFAPPADAGIPPDFNAAAHYTFFNGRVTPYPSAPARLAISGAADMDAMLSLWANNTYDPVRVDILTVGSNPSEHLFKIRNTDFGYDLLSIQIETGNVGIGTDSPTTRLTVVDSINAKIEFKRDTVSGAIEQNMNGGALRLNDTTNTTKIQLRTYGGSYFNGGNVGVGTSAPEAKLDINGTNGYEQLRLRTSYTPTNSSDINGNTGDIAWDDSYVYIKTSAGWKRASLSTW